MGVEVVPYENDFLGPGEMDIAKLFENLCVVDGRAALGNFDVAPTFERGKQHEQAGRAVALVFVVVTCRSPGLNGKRRSRFCDELFGCLVQAHERSGRVVRAGIHFQYILHRGHEPCVGLGRDDPVFLQVRFDVVFFSARASVLKWALSTILRSMTCSANRRIVQRARPAGGFEQASASSPWTEDPIGRSPRRWTAVTRCTTQAQTRSNPIPRAFIHWSSFCAKRSTLAQC